MCIADSNTVRLGSAAEPWPVNLTDWFHPCLTLLRPRKLDAKDAHQPLSLTVPDHFPMKILPQPLMVSLTKWYLLTVDRPLLHHALQVRGCSDFLQVLSKSQALLLSAFWSGEVSLAQPQGLQEFYILEERPNDLDLRDTSRLRVSGVTSMG